MFEQLQEKSKEIVDSIQEKSKAFSDSVDSLNRDWDEIRSVFVSIRDTVAGIFSFMGKETTILIACTFLFLFVMNLIPFFFFDKKTRYVAGIGFGIFLGVFFSYTSGAVLKYVFIMLLPVAIEYLLVTTCKGIGGAFSKFLKKSGLFLWKTAKRPFNKLNSKKEAEEKHILK